LRLQSGPSFGSARIDLCPVDLGGIRTFVFERDDDFPEILEFVRTSNTAHNLHVEELEGDFKSGLKSLLDRFPIKAVIIGTRRYPPPQHHYAYGSMAVRGDTFRRI
jgi:hypothetical protein